MKRIPIIVLALLAIGLPLRAQIVRIDFTATVTELQGTVPAGVSLGSSITGHVQVDLQYLPTPDDSAPWLTVYSYAGIPGYIVQFDTGTQSIALDSVSAENNAGTSPGIFFGSGCPAVRELPGPQRRPNLERDPAVQRHLRPVHSVCQQSFPLCRRRVHCR